LGAILAVVGERILGNLCSEKVSFTDLGLVATTLQKLIDCHIALKSLMGCGTVAGTISQEVIDSIQTQLDLL
jgi:hypothetical protein